MSVDPQRNIKKSNVDSEWPRAACGQGRKVKPSICTEHFQLNQRTWSSNSPANSRAEIGMKGLHLNLRVQQELSQTNSNKNCSAYVYFDSFPWPWSPVYFEKNLQCCIATAALVHHHMFRGSCAVLTRASLCSPDISVRGAARGGAAKLNCAKHQFWICCHG